MFKGVGAAVLFYAVLLLPSFAAARPPFEGEKGSYTVNIRLIQCRVDDGFPEGLDALPGLMPAQSHPACAQFNAHILADVSLKLKPNQLKTWEEIKVIPLQKQAYTPVFEDSKFTLTQETQQAHPLKAGITLKVYLDHVKKGQAVLALMAQHYSVEANGEEVWLHSKRGALLNPQAHQTEQISIFNVKTPVGEEEIWGGESALKTPAKEEVPKVYPERGRLWAEVKVE